MKLSSYAFNTLLYGLGQTALWHIASVCPCRSPHSGAARQDCLRCHGKGVTWGEGVEGVVGFASAALSRKFAAFGQFLPGDVVLSIPEASPLYSIGLNDRVTLTHSEEFFSLGLVHTSADRLTLSAITIDRVFWLDAHQQVVQGGLPEISDTGHLIWSEGEPPLGTQYTLEGWAHPDFYVYMDLVKDRPYHQGEDLPRRVVLRRFDLWGR